MRPRICMVNSACLVCKKGRGPLCSICRKNPFRVEDYRHILASKNKFNDLRKTYTFSYAFIKNKNNSRFWNTKFRKKTKLSDQDGMTRDRVKIAASWAPAKASKILDIAAGYGYLEELLCHKNVKLYANDISNESVDYLKKRFKGEFRVEDILKMDYPKHFFDCVYLLEVLEHVSPRHTFQVLQKIKQILKKDGTFVVSVPLNEGLEHMKNNPSAHVRTYSSEVIKAEIELVGFSIIQQKTFSAFSNFYSIKKILNVLIKKWNPNNIIIAARPL